MRFDFVKFFGADEAEAGQAVGFSALAEVFEAGEFFGVSGDDDLAANVVGDGVFAAELNHGRGAGQAEAGFQRAWFVVDTGVDDAAVVSALVAGNAVFFFENEETEMGETTCDLEGDGEAYDAAADDDYVVVRVGHGVSIFRMADSAGGRSDAQARDLVSSVVGFLSPLRGLLFSPPAIPRLGPWAAFFRRFAALAQNTPTEVVASRPSQRTTD